MKRVIEKITKIETVVHVSSPSTKEAKSEDCNESEVSLVYIISSRSAWDIDPRLIIFIVATTYYLTKKIIRFLFWLTVLKETVLGQGGWSGRGNRLKVHFDSTVKRQREVLNSCTQPAFYFFFFYSIQDSSPQNSTILILAHLFTSFNLVQKIPHRHVWESVLWWFKFLLNW